MASVTVQDELSLLVLSERCKLAARIRPAAEPVAKAFNPLRCLVELQVPHGRSRYR
jgi:hypothetical protein